MIDPDLTEWEKSDRHLHQPDERGFCVTCSTRMPCDWTCALDDMKRAAIRIEELETEHRRLKEAYDELSAHAREEAEVIKELRGLLAER